MTADDPATIGRAFADNLFDERFTALPRPLRPLSLALYLRLGRDSLAAEVRRMGVVDPDDEADAAFTQRMSDRYIADAHAGRSVGQNRSEWMVSDDLTAAGHKEAECFSVCLAEAAIRDCTLARFTGCSVDEAIDGANAVSAFFEQSVGAFCGSLMAAATAVCLGDGITDPDALSRCRAVALEAFMRRYDTITLDMTEPEGCA